MKSIVIAKILAVLLAFPVQAQECNCKDELSFIMQFLKENYPGYPDKVNEKTYAEYNSFTQQLSLKAEQATGNAECVLYIGRYIGFFRDQHIQFGSTLDWSALTTEAREQIIGSREMAYISPDKIETLKNSTGIEGIWWTPDSTYQIAIIKDHKGFREYAGITLYSRNPNWSSGQVKIDLVRTADDRLDGVMYFANHQPYYVNYTISPNRLGNGWVRHGSVAQGGRTPALSSRKLSDSTLYLQMGTFAEWNALPIDSLVEANRNHLETMPNLIIDIRNNGGGSTFSFMPIMPYIYTDPIHMMGSDVLATPHNTKAWEALLDNPFIPEEMKPGLEEFIANMRNHPGMLIKASPDTIVTLGMATPIPRNIVVLFNGNTASASEILIQAARQSSKVTLMGENSAGILDYADMRAAPFSCMPFELGYATTRSRAIDLGKGIDNVGIPPDIFLTNDQDWVQEALKYIERKR
ncbi:MAG: S41 family peptidase [Bacteroidales bacterium]